MCWSCEETQYDREEVMQYWNEKWWLYEEVNDREICMMSKLLMMSKWHWWLFDSILMIFYWLFNVYDDSIIVLCMMTLWQCDLLLLWCHYSIINVLLVNLYWYSIETSDKLWPINEEVACCCMWGNSEGQLTIVMIPPVFWWWDINENNEYESWK